MHVSEKDIKKAQKWLKNLGSSIKVNGRMTIGLASAIYAFQRKNMLSVTGELDEPTWKALKRENSLLKRLKRRFTKVPVNQNGN